ncbi:MAG: ABC transporter permease [Chloracidobacterium sp.]|nr:ABC transporter permease [Chloracidobacterium sp.]
MSFILWLRGREALLVGSSILTFFCLIAVFADLIAPYDYSSLSRMEPFAPPTAIRFRDAQGRWHSRPFIYARRMVDPMTQRYEEITDRAYPLELFTRGYSYKLLGLFPTDLHLFGARADAGAPRVYLLGADKFGRDRLSRLLMATRYSLLIGPTGALLASALGVLIGVAAGYVGGWTDVFLMRAADLMLALPTLVLILAVRATFPLGLPPADAIKLLLALFVLLGWAEMARLARSLTRELRQREYVMAAVSLGCSPARIIVRHILPGAAMSLAERTLLLLPAFLLLETALSYLGVGLQEPEASWGSLLAYVESNLFKRGHALAELSPALAITLFVLGARLFGDGLGKEGRERDKIPGVADRI